MYHIHCRSFHRLSHDNIIFCVSINVTCDCDLYAPISVIVHNCMTMDVAMKYQGVKLTVATNMSTRGTNFQWY